MKTWLITGCSSGIGRGIAKAALEKGDQVVVTARNPESVKSLTEAYPDTALAVALDVTKTDSISDALRQAHTRFGTIDVLVNNAGHGYRSALEEGEPDNVAELFQTNVFGPVELIKAVLPDMRAQKSGAIINISSIAAVRSGVGSGYYAASKAALELLSDALWQEASSLGIKVMIVEPGAFRTNFYDGSLKGTKMKIGDYAETAGKTRKENVVDHKDQPGDPERAGKVIVDVLNRENLPMRLLLGSDAVTFVRRELKQRLDELDAWEQVSVASDFS
ncbi:MAG: SDR family NAD(P)-dependent oxidoreductase [Lachnospiraceae bacterium]|nr:SDR family NAD(P)-dependent oxidoreductase [Lachnospiraceae bacterium]